MQMPEDRKKGRSRDKRGERGREGEEARKRGFPGGAVVENLPANAGDTGLSPGLGGSHEIGRASCRERV